VAIADANAASVQDAGVPVPTVTGVPELFSCAMGVQTCGGPGGRNLSANVPLFGIFEASCKEYVVAFIVLRVAPASDRGLDEPCWRS